MTTDATPQRRGFGVDVGGSGIKGGIVDLDTGQLIGDRFKLLTPQPATPPAVAKTIADVVNEFGWTGPLAVSYTHLRQTTGEPAQITLGPHGHS